MNVCEFNMRSLLRRLDPISKTALLGFSLAVSACGGGGSRSGMLQVPITVSLPISTVIVTRGDGPMSVPIQIRSISETALVSVGNLPGGVQVTYAASDTNPSGSLTFTANASTMTGTFMPFVTVISANQTASLGFTLVVKSL